MVAPRSLRRIIPVVALVCGFTVAGGVRGDEPSAGEFAATLSPLQAPFQSMTGDELFRRLLEHNRLRDIRLQRYSAVRTYDVANDKGKLYAEEVVRVEYQAPDHKRFVIDSEKGSGLVRDLVLKRL